MDNATEFLRMYGPLAGLVGRESVEVPQPHFYHIYNLARHAVEMSHGLFHPEYEERQRLYEAYKATINALPKMEPQP